MTRCFLCRSRQSLPFVAALLSAMLWASALAAAEEAQWIWSPEHDKESVPQVACHFRKTIYLRRPVQGTITLLADDRYELFCNGRRLGTAEGTERLVEYDVTPYLTRGRNIVAIKVSNDRGSSAGLAARVMIKEQGDSWRSYSTDDSWKASLSVLPLWHTALYNDNRWDFAQVFGTLGETAPFDIREEIAAGVGDVRTERFKIASEFMIEELLGNEDTGSLITLAFNEFGHILAGQSEGPLLLIYDSDNDQRPDKTKVYCEAVENCQGILPLNGAVYVTAQGPEGTALYRLADKNRDGELEDVRALIKFRGEVSEHGPHGVTLGPDGMLYVVVGNHAQVDGEIAETSPYRGYYEGDLPQPRYEDPGGHAVGVKAPGGVILRTDLEGSNVEYVAGGLRNAYDLAFNRQGELFVHDSDMESDQGMTWYRPTRLHHVIPGAEFGWRSGWANWPNYFCDSLPEILDTGRGSPTGAVFYNHFAFPTRYHDQLFLADWSQGRILNVELKRQGATFSATSEVFLEGQPLNVTDLDVGPDGALYFVTGGRGTSGGLYRVAWKGTVPDAVQDLGQGISTAIRQPQLNSAWSRQKIAGIKTTIAESWDSNLVGVARSKANPWYYRVRALSLMQLFGPAPSNELLLRLARDESEIVRAKAAEMMGLHADERTRGALTTLLADSDRGVRRKACEALLRAGQTPALAALRDTLVSDDRAAAWAARRLLERVPVGQWRDEILRSPDHRLFVQGSLALLIAQPSPEHAQAVLDRFNELSDGFVTDSDFVDMLRLSQVALQQGGLGPDDVPELRRKLGEEFPSGNSLMNRELVRLLVYLQVGDPLDRYLAFLKSDSSDIDKLHLAMHLRYLNKGWQPGQRLTLLEFLQQAAESGQSGHHSQFVQNVQRDVARSLPEDEVREVLARAEEWPNAALGALYGLPEQLDPVTVQQLQQVDRQLRTSSSESTQLVRVGIVAVMAASGDDESLAYLRSLWEEDPEHRQTITIGLAQAPDGPNWEYLVKSLPVLEADAAREVLQRLLSVDRAPEDPEAYRQAILLGLSLQANGANHALALLRHWTSQQVADENAPWEEELQAWQAWYTDEYPDRPPAVLPVADQQNKWKFDELLSHLTSEAASDGSAARGQEVFKKAQCAKCHRMGNLGESLGPDLTTASKRFMKKEMLQAILFPSHVISDQYASKTIITTSGRTYTGLIGAGAAGEKIVLQANGEKATVKQDQIEEILASSKSAMPDGLLNDLTLEEISDLFAYLGMLPEQSIARGSPRDQRN